MHANELLHNIVRRIVTHTEAEREELAAAVDVAFPAPAEPADGGTTTPTAPAKEK